MYVIARIIQVKDVAGKKKINRKNNYFDMCNIVHFFYNYLVIFVSECALLLVIVNSFCNAAEAILLGFQHYLVMLGTTVLIPTSLVPQMGGGHVRNYNYI